jgi:hypothetical protein
MYVNCCQHTALPQPLNHLLLGDAQQDTAPAARAAKPLALYAVLTAAAVHALRRWRTHRSPEYFVNFRRFKLPVSLEAAKRRCYKALSRYSETQAHMESLKELCIDVYHRHHARKVAAW